MTTDSNILELEIKQGQDEEYLLTLKNEDLTLINLAGFTFTGQVRDTFLGSVVFSFAFVVQDQVTNQGDVKMTVAGSITSKVRVNQQTTYLYDVEMNSGSKKTRILEGRLIFSPGVTR